MIKAIFFDVDGTLLSHRTKQIPQDTKQVLKELQESGIKIFMSTGRHSTELSRLPVNDVEFDGYITLNGQLCLDKKRQVIFGKPFDKDTTSKLVSIFKSEEVPLALVEAKRIYINFVNDTVCKAQESISTPIPDISTYNDENIYQATTFLKRDEEAELQGHLPKECKFARWCDNGVDIISAEGGKVEGIKYFCNLYKIEQNEIMAFGDAENDIDMLKYAYIGVAMGNAQDSVKKISDYVTSDIDENGIKNAIQFYNILPNLKQQFPI